MSLSISFFCFLLFVFVSFVFSSSLSVSFHPPSVVDYKARLRECSDSSHCGPLLDAVPSCLTSCISLSCHHTVYGEPSEALEPGELDTARWKDFEKCAQQESKKSNK
jgi:hypothetical protein